MYTIIAERPKALKIEAQDGTTFWVQRRWMRADGTLTPAGETAKRNAEDRRAERDVTAPMPIAWENEKSIGIDYSAEFTLSSSVNAKPRRVRAFVAKSAIEIRDGMALVPVWLEQKVREEALAREKAKGLHRGYEIIGVWKH